jgi:ABC-type transport system involved in multi-copper enzyme maturation permease subunit
MISLIKAEFRKLLSTRGAFGLLAVAIAVNIFAVVAPGENAVEEFSKPLQEQQWAFIVATLMRIFLLILGIRAVTDEYRHGTMTPTLLAVPRRPRLVAAKVISLAGSGVVVASLATTALIGAAMTVTALNDTTLGPGSWPMFAGIILSGALWPVIGVGIGFIVRGQVAAIVGGIVWLMGIEEMVRGRLGDLAGYLPGQAGLGLAVSPSPKYLWGSALILGAYAAGTAAAGAMLLRWRDVA